MGACGESKELAEARSFEMHMEEFIDKATRPVFHLSPRVGWMNDPNGFSFYDGLYHLFYQYNPYKVTWAPMHWGHAVSRDLLTWEYLPVAMAPDTTYDGYNGCFSGSALTLPDGRQLLMYTSVGMGQERPDGSYANAQTQSIAIGDGINYTKYEGNPVITSEMLPEGASTEHFRDPKIWQEADGSYRCVVGSLDANQSGQILMYRSKDCLNWEYVGPLIENHGRFGTMWECPDFFALDGYDVLLTSPQNMLPVGHEYYSGNGTLCVIGTLDQKSGHLEEQSFSPVESGMDFYAPQTMLTPDGRRVMVAWMQNWDSVSESPNFPWFGMMTVPRELHISNGHLVQWPVRELEECRSNRIAYQGVEVSQDVVELKGIRGRVADILLDVDMVGDDPYEEFVIWFAQDERFHCSLRYRPAHGTLKINRIHAGSRRAYVHHRKLDVPGAPTHLSLRLVLDRHSVEIFVNGGIKAMTMTIPTDLSADAITFFARGKAVMSIEKYDLT